MIKKLLLCSVSIIPGILILFMGHFIYAADVEKGKTLYDEKCTICHGENGKGDGPAASALSPPPKDFNRSAFWEQKDIDQIITKQVKNGKGAMPAFDLQDSQIQDIIAYMKQAFKP